MWGATDTRVRVARDERTRALLETTATAEDPGYRAYVNEAEIIGEFSHCFRDLKRPAELVRFAEQAVAQTVLVERSYVRSTHVVRAVDP